VTPDLHVRLERAEDRNASLEVERAAFGATGETDVAIVVAVRDEVGSFALVALENEEVVGHVQFSRGSIGETPVVALGPIGVRPDRQRIGIGRALIRAGVDEARRRGEAAVMLLGDPAYYARSGFGSAARYGLRNPFTGTTETGFVIDEGDFRILVLDPAARLEGDVRWHPAFG
jgi:putative acetyltransferase